ncbi:MAG: tetratricopeptide repeat protein [Spirochaetota bacterium]|nr:MAG: tetratricopeptide repeat protein [Spirochaetota bacterium]
MAAQDFKRKLTAILHADVKGYSQLMGEDEAQTLRTLTTYFKIMTDLIEKYSGRVVNTEGDAMLADFASVVDAVQCAVDIQKDLKEKNSSLPENHKLEFRIGINLGDVIAEKDDIYGDGVNIAARVEALADGGGICISQTAYEQVENKLDLGYEDLGEHAVKNIAKPVRVYRVLMEPGIRPSVAIRIKKTLRKHWKKAVPALVAVLISAFGVWVVWHFYLPAVTIEPASAYKMAFPLPDEPSIAVLPFDNMSGDPDQEYFSDGITEEIITGLSKVPGLFVIARNSTFAYKGRPVDIRQVAEELGVQYVLEGSVQRSGNKVRITAQLIDALTGRHLWADKYDREFEDLFALQEEITFKIITSLQVELIEGEQASLLDVGTDNLEAYLKSLKAMEYFYRVNKEGNALARQTIEESIALDPEYAAAYAVLALTHINDIWLGSSESPVQSLMQATELTQKAIALDDSLSGAHATLAWILLNQRQYEMSISEAEKAITLDPNSSDAYTVLGTSLNYMGRHEEAIQMFKKAIRLNPIFPSIAALLRLGVAYRDAGHYEKAIETCKQVLNLAPDSVFAHTCLASSYSLLGREDEARAEAAEVLRIDPMFSLDKAGKQLPYINQADRELVIDSLRKAGLK